MLSSSVSFPASESTNGGAIGNLCPLAATKPAVQFVDESTTRVELEARTNGNIDVDTNAW
jgi:hypothetical protein